MSFLKKSLLIIVVFITIGLLGYSTWHQWNSNQVSILERMEPIRPIAEFSHGDSIRSITFSPKHSDLIVSAGEGKKIKVWNRKNTEQPEFTLINDPTNVPRKHDVNFIGFSPIDAWFLSKSDRVLSIWDATTWKRIRTIYFDRYPSSAEAISPIGHLLATANIDLILWDISNPYEINGLVIFPKRMEEKAILLEGVSFSEQDKLVSYRLHDSTLLHGYQLVDFSHDEKWIAAHVKVHDHKLVREWIDTVIIWNLQTKQIHKIIENTSSEILSTDEDATQKKMVIMNEGMRKMDLKSQSQHFNPIRSIKFSPDNRYFAMSTLNSLTIWSFPDWNIYHEIINQSIYGFEFSPDGKMFATAGLGGIILWSVESLTPITILTGNDYLTSISATAFSHDSSMIAGGGSDGNLLLWDVRNINEK